MAEIKTVGNYNGPNHFVLKKQMEAVLQGKDDHLTIYTKINDAVIKRVCNRTDAELDKDEVIVEVTD